MRWKNSLELDLNLKYGFIKLKNMSSFIIEGGHRLKGNITPQGAKNEALQVICATLLTRERVTIENIPDILDVNNLIELLHDLGVEINKIESGVFTFKSENIDISYTETEEFRRKRLLPAPRINLFSSGKAFNISDNSSAD
jgi:UDP-N-acetylglucosamine enolpyruvyl transferase